MVGRVASRAAYRRFRAAAAVDCGRPWALAAVLFLTGVMFMTPPAVAVLIMAGVIR